MVIINTLFSSADKERLTKMSRIGPEYSFVNPNTLLFLTGVPLSGKSTIAPQVASMIDDCTVQNMDIIRLLAQERELQKPEGERNPFVRYGACDSFYFVGDGSYTPESLIIGFNAYAHAVSSLLDRIVPKLEAQGAQRVLFEGAQLTPQIVSPFLDNKNKLIIITSDADKLRRNRDKRYGQDPVLVERYSVERILLLQEEIIRQGQELPPDKRFFVENTRKPVDSIQEIVRLLIVEGVIV